MATYSTNEFKSGLKVILEGDPCNIIENEFVKPGKGQAFNRVKLKNLKTGRVWERTFKSGESIQAADVLDLDMEYMYTDGEYWHFMRTDGTYDQLAADKSAVEDCISWLKENYRYVVTLWDETPIAVTPPNFVELEIIDTDPGLKGDTAQGGSKPATLSTGAIVKVPLFINIGETVRVDTRTGEYQNRVKGQHRVRGYWASEVTQETLILRDNLLRKIRNFFCERGVLEVTTPTIGIAGASEKV